MKRRHRPGEPGRLKIKMADLLTAAGFTCEPEQVWCQEGHYRIHGQESRWGASVIANYRRLDVASWNTMTECARHGIDLTYMNRDGWVVTPKEGMPNDRNHPMAGEPAES